MEKIDKRVFLALQGLVFCYACATMMQKLAARYSFPSAGFVLCYAGVLFFLAVYALGWQQVIKRLPLTVAFANKAVSYVWMLVLGALLFQERVRPTQVLGCAIVAAGVVLFVRADGEDAHDA